MRYAWYAFKHFAPGLVIGLFLGAIVNLIIILHMIKPIDPETKCFPTAVQLAAYCRTQREW